MVNGGGRLRIYRFSCGLTNTFYNDKVFNFSTKEYVSPIAETVPSSDTTITVVNYDMYYNPDNPESTLAYLELGQEVRVAFGYDVTGNGDIEWLLEKKSYLKTWKANESQAVFTSVDLFDFIGNNTSYVRGKYSEEGTPLYDIAVDVLKDLGVADYFIDTSLKDIMINNPMPVVKHSAALQIIANAGRCILREGRSGQITWNNPLVSTPEHAEKLQEWLSSYYLGDVEYQIDWKGDPAVDANDLFHLETKVGTSFVRAYENSLTFNGRWRGKLKARKVARV